MSLRRKPLQHRKVDGKGNEGRGVSTQIVLLPPCHGQDRQGLEISLRFSELRSPVDSERLSAELQVGHARNSSTEMSLLCESGQSRVARRTSCSFAENSQTIELLKRRVEFRFEHRIGGREAVHYALRPREVFLLPLEIPIRRRAEED